MCCCLGSLAPNGNNCARLPSSPDSIWDMNLLFVCACSVARRRYTSLKTRIGVGILHICQMFLHCHFLTDLYYRGRQPCGLLLDGPTRSLKEKIATDQVVALEERMHRRYSRNHAAYVTFIYSSTVWDICFNPDGSQMIVAVTNRVLMYDAVDANLLQVFKNNAMALIG